MLESKLTYPKGRMAEYAIRLSFLHEYLALFCPAQALFPAQLCRTILLGPAISLVYSQTTD
jgi:hypothetical protein